MHGHHHLTHLQSSELAAGALSPSTDILWIKKKSEEKNLILLFLDKTLTVKENSSLELIFDLQSLLNVGHIRNAGHQVILP